MSSKCVHLIFGFDVFINGFYVSSDTSLFKFDSFVYLHCLVCVNDTRLLFWEAN